jgi:hypothetical protein
LGSSSLFISLVFALKESAGREKTVSWLDLCEIGASKHLCEIGASKVCIFFLECVVLQQQRSSDFFIHIEEIMTQSSSAAVAKGQRKGKDICFSVTPPHPTPSATVSAPSAESGAAISAHNTATTRKRSIC